MIVAMQELADEGQIQQVIEHLVKMGFEVHRSTGARQTVLGAVKFGSNGQNLKTAQSALIFQWQPGGHFVQVLPKATLGAQAIIRVKPSWTG